MYQNLNLQTLWSTFLIGTYSCTIPCPGTVRIYWIGVCNSNITRTYLKQAFSLAAALLTMLYNLGTTSAFLASLMKSKVSLCVNHTHNLLAYDSYVYFFVVIELFSSFCDIVRQPECVMIHMPV